MKTQLKKSLIATLVVTPLFISHVALGADSTLGNYQIYGTGTPFLKLDEKTAGKTDWYMFNDFGISGSFSLFWDDVDAGSNGKPIVVETGTANNLLYLDSQDRIGINKYNPVETLEIATTQPGIRLDDTSTGAGYVDLEMVNNSFRIEGNSGQPFIFAETPAPSYSLYINSDGKIGLGVANPSYDLHIGGSGDIYMENGGSDWSLHTGVLGLAVYNYDSSPSFPLLIGADAPSASLVVESITGDLGVGTSTPVAPLHVNRTNGTARIRVEEASWTTAKRVLYELVNNGEIRFSMKNVDPANQRKWDFLMATDGFNISLVGTGGAELLVQNDGGVRMGNKNGGASGFNPTFVLNPLGNLTIDGNLTEGSDRNNKQDIEPIDNVSVLETVVKLPISTWEYKGEDGVKHLGPMAQDFHAAFGLGNTPKGISSIDTGGVALAAIKGLNENLNEIVQIKNKEIAVQDEKISAQKQEIELLKQRLTRMEAQQKRLSQLEELLRDLTVKGDVAQR